MIIGIDASRAVSSRPTGTETYSFHLTQALLERNTSHQFRLYFRTPPPPGTLRPSQKDSPQVAHRVIPFPRLWTHGRLSWEMLRSPPDLLFVTAHVLPLIHPPLNLVTIHDLGYRHFPGAHPPLQRLYLDLSTRWNARAATHLLADSEATKRDLAAFYGTPPEKVTVAYPGYDESLRPVRGPTAIAEVKARHDVQGDYFLYLGTLQPRKNLSRLIAGFARLAHQPSLHLLIAGKPGWLYDDLFAQVRRLGLEGRVHFPGYIPSSDKAALLSGALAFVFPSLYEGFGLTVLEAQACGCPVICSNTSSLPEAAGAGALLVNPQDPAALAEGMDRLAGDPLLRADLIQRGFANLRRFSWQRCAKVVTAVIHRLAVGRPT